MSNQTVEVPDPGADIGILIRFASTYNAYSRLNSEPAQLERMFQEGKVHYDLTAKISENLGLDYLRGWLFLLQRQDHFSGGLETPRHLEELWRLIVARIQEISGGKVDELSD